MANPITTGIPTVTTPGPDPTIDQGALGDTALDGVDDALRANKEKQDLDTLMEKGQAYSHRKAYERADAWTR